MVRVLPHMGKCPIWGSVHLSGKKIFLLIDLLLHYSPRIYLTQAWIFWVLVSDKEVNSHRKSGIWGCSLVAKPCPTLCNPKDYSPPGSSVRGISLARIMEWAAMSFSRGSSQTRDRTHISFTAGEFFTVWATREASLVQGWSLPLPIPRTDRFCQAGNLMGGDGNLSMTWEQLTR